MPLSDPLPCSSFRREQGHRGGQIAAGLEGLRVGMLATNAVATSRAIRTPSSRSMVSLERCQARIGWSASRICCLNQTEPGDELYIGDLGKLIALVFADDPKPTRRCSTYLATILNSRRCAGSASISVASTNEHLAVSVQDQPLRRSGRLDHDEAHRRPLMAS